MAWVTVEKIDMRRDRMRCDVCGDERVANRIQAKSGKLCCWTCRGGTSGARRNTERAPVGLPDISELTPLEGRMPQRPVAYARAVRWDIHPSLAHNPDAEVQRGRIEIAGLRTRNPLNRRLHWTAVAASTRQAQKNTLEALRFAFQGFPLPDDGEDYCYEVRLSRCGVKGIADDEGIAGMLKGVRDAFAVHVRINDGNRRRLRFTYHVGKAPIQCVILEWTRRRGTFDDEGIETPALFTREELYVLRNEHRVTSRYWKERRARIGAAKRFDEEFERERGDEEGEGGDSEHE